MVEAEPAVQRGEIWWADLGEPRGSGPGFQRPVLIVQSNRFNRSRVKTVIAIVITTNTNLADAPGNVFLPAHISGLPRDSVVNVSQLVTVDRDYLMERVGKLNSALRERVNDGLRKILGL